MKPPYTVYGSAEVDAQVESDVFELRDMILARIPSDNLEGIVLLGGYGKSEGGVYVDGETLYPYNNYDLLVIVKDAAVGEIDDYRLALDEIDSEFTESHTISVDFSIMQMKQIRNAPFRIFFYDLKFGHKIVWGPEDLLNAMPDYDLHKIPMFDAEHMIVNRGTLLVINRFLFSKRREDLTFEDKKAVIKHTAKAIIGYGDALLVALKRYSWSYREKQHIVTTLPDSDVKGIEKIRPLYDQAAELRFRADYSPLIRKNLEKWQDEVTETLEAVHRRFERLRLDRSIFIWDNFVNDHGAWLWSHALEPDRNWAYRTAKRFAHLFRGLGDVDLMTVGIKGKLGYRTAGPREILVPVLPRVLYDNLPLVYIESVERFLALQEKGGVMPALRRYLELWGTHGDHNFRHSLAEMGLSLDD